MPPSHLMRVAYLIGRYPAVSHTFILREVLGLRRLGIEVETISINQAGAADALSVIDREEAARTFAVLPPKWPELLTAHALALVTRPRRYFRAFALGMRLANPGLRGRLWALFYFAEMPVVWRYCRRRGVDHIHVHHLNQASNVAMMAIALEGPRATGAPLTWSYTMHGPDEFADVSQFRLKEKARNASAVACISDFARSQVMAVLDPSEWEKLRVIHCGIDPNDFDRPSLPPEFSNARDPTPLRLLYVGRMVPVKGQNLLLDAVAQLRLAGIEVALTMIGQGPRLGELEREVRARGLESVVTLPGAVSQDVIRSYYAEAHVFVLPSFAEGVPVVLMEAMAMGLPVVTTRVGGIPELVEHGESGFIIPPGRVDSLVDALTHLARDSQLRQRMGARGRARIKADYDIATSCEQLRDMFEAVIAGL